MSRPIARSVLSMGLCDCGLFVEQPFGRRSRQGPDRGVRFVEPEIDKEGFLVVALSSSRRGFIEAIWQVAFHLSNALPLCQNGLGSGSGPGR